MKKAKFGQKNFKGQILKKFKAKFGHKLFQKGQIHENLKGRIGPNVVSKKSY